MMQQIAIFEKNRNIIKNIIMGNFWVFDTITNTKNELCLCDILIGCENQNVPDENNKIVNKLCYTLNLKLANGDIFHAIVPDKFLDDDPEFDEVIDWIFSEVKLFKESLDKREMDEKYSNFIDIWKSLSKEYQDLFKDMIEHQK